MSQSPRTFTFLFTDIQGSTSLWEHHPQDMQRSLARHDALLRDTIESNGGQVFKTVGDAFCAVFSNAADALAAALAAQQALLSESWPESSPIRVRMALHTGATEERDGDYFGPPLNRVARLRDIGHGRQTLVSAATYELVRDSLPADVAFRDMGQHQLKYLERAEHVYQVIYPGLPDAFPPLLSLDIVPNNLPQQLTSFIGREKEIAEVRLLLSNTRLLTLTGAGGCGKTRLCLQAAADMIDDYPDGAWWVELASLSDPALVASAVAQALGVQEQARQKIEQTLEAWLKSRRLLLLLDNCEHILSACADLIAALLRSCPQIKVLATSREAFGISGEQTYRVPSLTLPEPGRTPAVTPDSLSQYEAVRLFIERATAVKSDFTVTNANAPALASVCHRLGGIPLAIELAAARVRSLSVEDINARLDSRFQLLKSRDRSALPRQQTLQALIDWSYDLLGESEKVLLARLSVFSGGWTLSAAEEVCGFGHIEEDEVLDLLTGLVDKSLVFCEDADGSVRYGILETIREYAVEKREASGESAAMRDHHRDWCIASGEEAERQLPLFDWFRRAETEYDNLRAALAWCIRSDTDTASIEAGLRLGGTLWYFWLRRGHVFEGREWLARVLSSARHQEYMKSSSEGVLPLRAAMIAKSLKGAGVLAIYQGDYAVGLGFLEDNLAMHRELDDKPALAVALDNLGREVLFVGDHLRARFLFEESLAIYREAGNKDRIADSLTNLGSVALAQRDYALARTHFEESLAIRRESGNKSAIADSLYHLGDLALKQRDFALSQSLYEQCRTIHRELGDISGIAGSLSQLGRIAHGQENYALAQARFEEILAIRRDAGDKPLIAFALNDLGYIALCQGNYPSAQARHEEALAIRRELGNKPGIAGSLLHLGEVAFQQGDFASVQSLQEERLAINREIGDTWGVSQSLRHLGFVALQYGDYTKAKSLYAESLAVCRELGNLSDDHKAHIADSLESLAEALLHLSDAMLAATLLGAASALRALVKAARNETAQAKFDQRVEQARTVLSEESFATAWEMGRTLTWEQAVELALGKELPQDTGETIASAL